MVAKPGSLAMGVGSTPLNGGDRRHRTNSAGEACWLRPACKRRPCAPYGKDAFDQKSSSARKRPCCSHCPVGRRGWRSQIRRARNWCSEKTPTLGTGCWTTSNVIASSLLDRNGEHRSFAPQGAFERGGLVFFHCSSALPVFHAARALAENVARVIDTVVPCGPAKVSTWAPS